MTILVNILAIFRKELQSYFLSPLAYVVAGVFWLLSGIVFVYLLLSDQGIIQEIALSEQSGIPMPPVDVPYLFLLRYLGIIGSLTSFIVPLLSMGLYAEERKAHTLELLATSPVYNWVVALGKLAGVVVFYITLLMPMLVLELVAFAAADRPVPPAVPLLAHLALILLATALLSLGMFLSTLTSSTIIAAILTFTLVICLATVDLVAEQLGQPLEAAIAHLSLIKHYDTMVQGVFDSSSLFVFASYILLGIFLTAQSIELLRFQRS
jgi:ABC-2 type transport system permease protein